MSMFDESAGRYAVNATSLPHSTVRHAIDDVAATGGAGLGVWERTLPDGGAGADAEVVARLHDAGLRATYCVPSTHLILPSQIDPPGAPSDPRQRLEAICASIRRFAPFGPEMIVIGAGASGDPAAPAGPMARVLEALPVIDAVAAECGVTVGLEVLAGRRGSPLPRIRDVVDVLDRAGVEHIGAMVSVFHSWDEPDLHEHLRTHVGRIVGVQVCDIREVERCPFDRELPGRGRGVAPAIIATLLDAGYRGWWELEIFSDDGTYGTTLPDSYWAMPPREFLAAARDAFDGAFARAVELCGAASG